jgi:hypothetical protein
MPQRFNRGHFLRTSRFLDMMYTPAEIAEELEVSVDTVYRSYLPDGAPYERDKQGNIWIHGISFASWVRRVYQTKKRYPMQKDEAWCCRGNKPVQLIHPIPKKKGRYVIFLQAKCPICKCTINRAISSGVYSHPQAVKEGKGKNDQS